ncbi:hypothetical protein ACFQZC_15585 [Streptacidiphilus monticola]
MAELERGLAEAHPETEPQELTPLHRMLGGMALRTRQYRTAVRAFSEAAARLDREGRPEQARETRWELSRALRAQGSSATPSPSWSPCSRPLRRPPTAWQWPRLRLRRRPSERGQPIRRPSGRTRPPRPASGPRSHGGAERHRPQPGRLRCRRERIRACGAGPSASPERGTDSDPGPPPWRAQRVRRGQPWGHGRTRPDGGGAGHGGAVDGADTGGSGERAAVAGEHRAAAAEFLQLADAVSRWPDKAPLTSAAAGAAGALALAGNWDGARAALDRALASNAEAPDLPDLTDTLRTLAVEAVDARGNDAVTEALGYLDRADALREEFAEAARAQFVSVEVDEAQCWYTRGRVHAATGEPAAALDAFEQAVAVYERAGYSDAPPRFEALRMAALVEGRGLDRADAARARLDKAAAEADAAELPDAAATLRRLRDSLG